MTPAKTSGTCCPAPWCCAASCGCPPPAVSAPEQRASASGDADARRRGGLLGSRVSALPDRRLPRRLTQLYVGLVAFAFGEALIVRANLGVMSWDGPAQGLTRHLGLSIGQSSK